jgi:hypothetical protein
MRDLGVTYAVMVLKQHCGWAMWPSNTTLPDGSTYRQAHSRVSTAVDLFLTYFSRCLHLVLND